MATDNPVTQNAATPLHEGLGEPGFDRYGPILSIERFKAEYLFGIPLKSSLTGEEITDETIKQFIRKGIGEVETSVRIPVNPVKIEDRFDFERADDLAFGTRQTTRWPVIKVENLKALWPGRNDNLSGVITNGSQEIDYPTSWVVINGDMGLFRVVPNSGTLVNADVNFLASSAYRSVVLGGLKQWPNMWRIIYIAGIDFDKVPDVINDLIGTFAAIKLLSQLGPVIFPLAAQSISLDGMSQATTTAGPAWLANRVQELMVERDRLVKQLKSIYGTDMMLRGF